MQEINKYDMKHMQNPFICGHKRDSREQHIVVVGNPFLFFIFYFLGSKERIELGTAKMVRTNETSQVRTSDRARLFLTYNHK